MKCATSTILLPVVTSIKLSSMILALVVLVRVAKLTLPFFPLKSQSNSKHFLCVNFCLLLCTQKSCSFQCYEAGAAFFCWSLNRTRNLINQSRESKPPKSITKPEPPKYFMTVELEPEPQKPWRSRSRPILIVELESVPPKNQNFPIAGAAKKARLCITGSF